MSCPNSPSPIDIVDSKITNVCSGTCEYAHSFHELKDIKVKHKKVCLEFETTLYTDKPDVIFNKENYMVSRILLFKQPLHSYNQLEYEGEIIITLTTTSSKNLNLSIPLRINNGYTSNLDTIIDGVSKVCNSENCVSEILPTMNVSSMVPNNSYYYYQGENEFIYSDVDGKTNNNVNCSNIEHWIVFKANDSYTINNKTSNYLKDMLEPFNPTRYKNSSLSKSKGGPVSMQGGGDDIYIDCQLTGEDEEVLVPQPKYKLEPPDYLKNINSNRVFIAILFILLLVMVFLIYYKLLNYIMSQKNSKVHNVAKE